MVIKRAMGVGRIFFRGWGALVDFSGVARKIIHGRTSDENYENNLFL